MPPKVSGEPAMFSDMDSGGPWEQQYFHSFFAKVNSLEQQPDDSPGFFAFDLDKLPELLQRALLKRFVNKEELSDAEKKEIASYGDSVGEKFTGLMNEHYVNAKRQETTRRDRLVLKAALKHMRQCSGACRNIAQDPSTYDASLQESTLKKLKRLRMLQRTLEEEQSTIEHQLFHQNNIESMLIKRLLEEEDSSEERCGFSDCKWCTDYKQHRGSRASPPPCVGPTFCSRAFCSRDSPPSFYTVIETSAMSDASTATSTVLPVVEVEPVPGMCDSLRMKAEILLPPASNESVELSDLVKGEVASRIQMLRDKPAIFHRLEPSVVDILNVCHALCDPDKRSVDDVNAAIDCAQSTSTKGRPFAMFRLFIVGQEIVAKAKGFVRDTDIITRCDRRRRQDLQQLLSVIALTTRRSTLHLPLSSALALRFHLPLSSALAPRVKSPRAGPSRATEIPHCVSAAQPCGTGRMTVPGRQAVLGIAQGPLPQWSAPVAVTAEEKKGSTVFARSLLPGRSGPQSQLS